VQGDGEAVTTTPVSISLFPNAIRVISANSNEDDHPSQ
jgi:diacylglycerol kinase family enzyme